MVWSWLLDTVKKKTKKPWVSCPCFPLVARVSVHTGWWRCDEKRLARRTLIVLSLLMRAISAVFCLCLTSAGCPPTTLSSRGCGDMGPSDMYSSVHPEVGGVSSSAQPQPGKESLYWREDKGGRVMIFFLFVFVCYVELVQGFHRCIKICTVLFTFSRFGYRN